jgi:8-amino-7-oxononanoate synthase
MATRLRHDWRWIDDRLKQLDHAGLRRHLSPCEPVVGTMQVKFDGRMLVNFGSNDYLGIASEIGPWHADGSGSGASPLVSGYRSVQATLDRELAAWESADAAITLNSGFMANLAAIGTLPEEGDVVFSDALNHASIIDACRLTRAKRFVYPHNDLDALGELLVEHRSRYRRGFLLTDAVFSMDGDIAPLPALCDLCEAYDVLPIIDEAHATGIFGNSGSGLCEHFQLKDRIPLRTGTLSKAIGSAGGFVVGPAVVIEYLTQKSRSFIYSTAPTTPTLQLALDGIRRIHAQPERRQRLKDISSRLRHELQAMGLPIDSFPTPIVPIVIGDSDRAMHASKRLRECGLFVPAIRPPAVPDGTARLRISLSALHLDEQVSHLIDALQPIVATC